MTRQKPLAMIQALPCSGSSWHGIAAWLVGTCGSDELMRHLEVDAASGGAVHGVQGGLDILQESPVFQDRPQVDVRHHNIFIVPQFV